MRYLHLLFLFTLATLWLTTCDDDSGDGNNEAELMAQRITQLENLHTYGATAAFDNFAAACTELQIATEALVANVDAGNLATTQQRWQEAGEKFKKCELYDIASVAASFITFRIHLWPINAEDLVDTLASSVPVDATYISRLGSSVTGLGAIEFLLFEEDEMATLATLTADARRRDFLVETVRYLAQNAADMRDTWQANSSDFTQATQTRVSGGQNQMVNALLAFAEVTARTRLDKPLGEDNGGAISITRLEAHRSNASLAFIRSGFAEWKQYFYGNFPGSPEEYGFDDYLETLSNNSIEPLLQAAIGDCDNALAALDNLNDDLVNNTAQVEELRDSFQALATLIRNDLAMFIGSIITVNVTDGD